MLVGLLALLVSWQAHGAVAEKGRIRQPRNIYELVYGFHYTFTTGLLKGDDLRIYETHTPKEIQQLNPELYRRISTDVKRWTDEWIQHVETNEEPISQGRMEKANQLVEKTESILKQYFESRGWSYKPMRVVWIPPKAFADDRDRYKTTAGMFIPFYPDAFFATVDWPIPIELVLVHESLHYNAAERPFGGALVEGVTDTGARHIVRKYDLLGAGDVRQAGTYPREREGVEYVLERIAEKTGSDREQALDMLLGAYLTGNQDEMTKTFGKDAWDRVLRLSGSLGSWDPPKIKKALGK